MFVVLVFFEYWWRKHRYHSEISRKFIHITIGTFAAFWPYFLSWRQILGLSVAFIVVVLISKYLNIFQAIHTVERPTWGEVYFAAAVGLLTYLTHSPAVYCVALLHMGLADGLAAVVGTRYGKNNAYKVLGHTKSIAGTGAFLLCSIAILVVYATLQPQLISPIMLLGLAAAATVCENYGVRGLDNLVVPVLVAAVLNLV